MASGFPFALLLCLASGLLTAQACPEASHETCCSVCPPGWTQFGSRCFYYHYTKKNWWDAERDCLSHGGNLASIHTADENEFLREYMNRLVGSHRVTWLGCNDAVKEGFWMCSDGTPFNYNQWGSNQPDNKGRKEHCLQMNKKGDFWNDSECKKKFPYLCSMDLPCCDNQHKKKECH